MLIDYYNIQNGYNNQIKKYFNFILIFIKYYLNIYKILSYSL